MSVTTVRRAGSTARAAPAEAHDRYVDLVRVVSLGLVVVLHWLSVVPTWQDGRIADQSITGMMGPIWPLSWVGDVMPLFFFVGGFANRGSYRRACERGDGTAGYVLRRYRRLLMPAVIFLAAWVVLEIVLRVIGVGEGGMRLVEPGNTIPFGPLWFLVVYALIIGLTPLTVALHERHGLRVVVAMVIGVALCDVTAFMLQQPAALLPNVLLVWAIPHQLGYFYADGRLQRIPARWCWLLVLAGFGLLAALTSTPWYPRSVINPRYDVLGMDGPTSVLVAQTLWQVGAALLLRDVCTRWLARPRSWNVVRRLNDTAIAVYLWHMSAYMVVALVLDPLGFVFSAKLDHAWWWGRVPMELGSAVVLWLMVAAVMRLQRMLMGSPRPATGEARAGLQ